MLYNENEKTILDCSIKEWKIEKINVLKSLLEARFLDVVIFNYNYLKKDILEELIYKYPDVSFYTQKKIEAKNNFEYTSIKLHEIFTNKYKINASLANKIINLKVKLDNYYDESKFEILNSFNGISNCKVFIEFYSDKNEFNVKNYLVLLKNFKKNIRKIYLTSLFKYSNIIMEHPCNMYLCKNHSCHSKKNDFPRYLYLNDYGMYPYKVNKEPLKILGYDNVNYCDFEYYMKNIYKLSDAHNLFLKLNKKIYEDYIIFKKINIYPWNIMLFSEFKKVYKDE